MRLSLLSVSVLLSLLGPVASAQDTAAPAPQAQAPQAQAADAGTSDASSGETGQSDGGDGSDEDQTPSTAATDAPSPGTDGDGEAEPEGAAGEESEAGQAEEGQQAEETPAPAPRPYRGSIAYWQHGITANTLAPGAQLTYDPTYYQYLLLQPRWYLDAQNFLVLTQGAWLELTDSNATTTQHEPQLSDTTLEWRHTEAWEGFVFIPAVRLTAPLSLASQGAHRVLNTGLGLTVVRVFPELASLTIAAAFGYRHWFAASNVTASASAYHCVLGSALSDSCSQANGSTTERDRLIAGLSVTVSPISGMTVTTQYFWSGVYGHELAPGTTGAIGGPTTLPDGSPTHWRNLQYWALAVGYDVLTWLNLQLGYQSASSFTAWLNPNGSVRNPFYSPDSELYLAATLAFDVLVEELEGQTGEGPSPELRQRRRQGLARTAAGPSF